MSQMAVEIEGHGSVAMASQTVVAPWVGGPVRTRLPHLTFLSPDAIDGNRHAHYKNEIKSRLHG